MTELHVSVLPRNTIQWIGLHWNRRILHDNWHQILIWVPTFCEFHFTDPVSFFVIPYTQILQRRQELHKKKSVKFTILTFAQVGLQSKYSLSLTRAREGSHGPHRKTPTRTTARTHTCWPRSIPWRFTYQKRKSLHTSEQQYTIHIILQMSDSLSLRVSCTHLCDENVE